MKGMIEVHQYKLEIYLNDENGNPTKGRFATQYCDNADKAEALYSQYHDPFQIDPETEKATSCRVYTVKVHVLCYKQVAKPADFFAQFHA